MNATDGLGLGAPGLPCGAATRIPSHLRAAMAAKGSCLPRLHSPRDMRGAISHREQCFGSAASVRFVHVDDLTCVWRLWLGCMRSRACGLANAQLQPTLTAFGPAAHPAILPMEE